MLGDRIDPSISLSVVFERLVDCDAIMRLSSDIVSQDAVLQRRSEYALHADINGSASDGAHASLVRTERYWVSQGYSLITPLWVVPESDVGQELA